MPARKDQGEAEYETNPYEEFMKKHLSHYGYYTGRNEAYRSSALLFNDFNRTHGYQLSSESSSNDDSPSEDAGNDRPKTNQLVLSLKSGKLVPKLKEPRQLFPANNVVLGPQQKARWPGEIEVIEEKVMHISAVPANPEPFYVSTGQEAAPQIVGEEGGGRVVFQLKARGTPFFMHSRVGGTRGEISEAAVPLQGPDDKTLIFESRFESGNLAKAIQVGPQEYELWLRNDLYTSKHTQWYYFRVQNTRKNTKYRFTICNLMKSSSLYNDGMKPCYYSEKEAEQKKLGWRRAGSDIRYYKSNITYVAKKSERPYYALTFTMQFAHDHDTIYLSHCYPYTYADMQDYLQDVVDDPIKSKICRLRVLTRSLAGNLVYLVTITSASEDTLLIKNKKAVVITARVHPGETNGSWMMKGFLDYILSDAADAKLLRDTFIFKIIPMLNPDGVVVGNYRCSLAGRDLNRNYKSQLQDSYPTIMASKQMVKKLASEREVIMYCDLHGHSRKQNVFIYGCENRRNPKKRLHVRIFPAMLGKNAPDKFVFDECTFKIQKSKEGTGRVVMWNMGIMNSFTMEATFCGTLSGKNKNCHFSQADFESMGYHFCDTLLDYCDPDKTKFNNVLLELEATLKRTIMDQLVRLGRRTVTVNGKQVYLSDISDLNMDDIYSAGLDVSEDDGGSDSSVSDGLPVNVEYMEKVNNPQKRKKLTKKERDNLRKKKADQDSATTESKSVSSPSENSSGRPQGSAKTRHDKCHHNHNSTLKPVRRAMSAKRLRPNDLEGKVIRDDRERSNGYLQTITKEFLKSGDYPSASPAQTQPKKGHFRYSTSSNNKPLAMSLDGLSEDLAAEGSFSARFLLDQVREAEVKPAEQEKNAGHGLRAAYTSMAKGDGPHITHEKEIKSSRSDSVLPNESQKAEGSAMWSYQTSGRPRSSRPESCKTSDQQEAENRQTSGKLVRQHPLPFDTQSSGNGAVEGGHYSVPYVTRTPNRPITRQAQSSGRLRQANGNDISKKLVQELQDIKRVRETLGEEMGLIKTSPSTGRYLERMVSETDQDIEVLRAEIEDMQTHDPTVLELAARQRRLSQIRNGHPNMRQQKDDLLTAIQIQQQSPEAADSGLRRVQFKEYSELKHTVPRVSLHMNRHGLPPSTPKVSRRVQVRMVPSSQGSRRQY